MSVLSWPSTLGPQSMGFRMMPRTARFPSPVSGSETSQEMLGGKWGTSFTFKNLEPVEWQELQGILGALMSNADQVLLPDPVYSGLRGGATGTLLGTGNADSKVLTISNVGGTAPHFKRGDRFQLSTRMYMATADATASSGVANVSIWPPLRVALSAVPIAYVNPLCIMQLVDDSQGDFSFEEYNLLASSTHTFVEPLP